MPGQIKAITLSPSDMGFVDVRAVAAGLVSVCRRLMNHLPQALDPSSMMIVIHILANVGQDTSSKAASSET